MAIEFTRDKNSGYIAINDEMSIYTAAEQKARLLDCFSSCQDLELDLSEVSEIDSAGLQLLLMLKKQASADHKVVRYINHSLPVVEVIELLNLATSFGDPIVIPTEWQKK